MRWLNICRFLWHEIIRDVALTLAGLGIIGSQVLAMHPNIGLIGAGLALTAPATYQKLRELGGAPAGGGSGQSALPPPPEPPTPPGITQEATR